MLRMMLLGSAVLSISAPVLAQTLPPHLPADLSPASVRAADDHLVLEQVEGTEAMAFVRAQNVRSLAVLTGDPRYETFRAEAFDILSSTARIPAPSFMGEGIGNFWQDATNPKGLWRRTSLDSYRTDAPVWETLIDVDALSRAEGRDWVWKGANCLAPDETRCLVSLSEGGKDAVVVREFDTTTKAFVPDQGQDCGFVLPEGKHRLSWLDRDTLLIATDFGPGTLTESGYPYIVRALKRGQSLTHATEIYRGEQGDGGYGVSPSVYRDKDGAVEAVLFSRPLDTFRAQTWQWVDGRAVRLNLPERVAVQGTMGAWLIISLEEPWVIPGGTLPAGDLVAASLEALRQPEMVGTVDNPQVIFHPGPRQSLQDTTVMSDRIVSVVSDNVVGTLKAFTPETTERTQTGWRAMDISVPANSAVALGDSSRSRGAVFVSSQGFLTPPTLSLADVATGTLALVKQAPAQFDASTHVVEQFEAASTDGTMIPYFVVRPRNAPMDGSTPTVMFGYGGFQISYPPAYRPELGKLWLENGGAYVVANIRGGGEFGPAWHQAALRENRQRAFDDFAAVARDLATRGIASARHLGIYGRSNGGVLTSVSITQHPELFNAAVIESPLIDMLRYPDLPAGASWIGEYGDPRIAGDAAFIAGYSAYQQLRPEGAYPRLYITTNTRDDRVHPGHARKFAARLQDQGHDFLYYEETAGGHSNDADPVANARRWARHYVYLSQQLMD
jgi:prolyl oligopeptidase